MSIQTKFGMGGPKSYTVTHHYHCSTDYKARCQIENNIAFYNAIIQYTRCKVITATGEKRKELKGVHSAEAAATAVYIT